MSNIYPKLYLLNSSEKIKLALKEILHQKEFQPEVKEPSVWDKWLHKLSGWLDPVLKKFFAALHLNDLDIDPLLLAVITKAIIVIAILLVLFTVLYFYFGLNRRFFYDLKKAGLTVAETIISKNPEQVYSLAESSAKSGNFRLGIRYLYLALLLFLDQKGMIAYDPSKTNWEYLAKIRLDFKEAEGDFLSFTRLFDRKWYGLEDCTHQDYILGVRLYTEVVGRVRT